MTRENLVFLDTETTGTGKEDRLCQVAYIFQEREYEALFKPPIPITIDAMTVTHITNKMVADCEAFSRSEMYEHLCTLFFSHNILVAHNAPFDIAMLSREGIEVPQYIDTFKLAHFLDSEEKVPKKNLQYLRYFYDLDVSHASAHSAMGDVRVLQKLFDFFFVKMSEGGKTETVVLQEMIDISSQPILFRTFTFGKYTGRKISEIAEQDMDYIAWMLNQKIMTRQNTGEDDENWIYTLDYFFNNKRKPGELPF